MQKGYDGYIISYDSAARIGTQAVKEPIYPGSKKLETVYKPIPGLTLPEQLVRCGVKTIALDECQQIKNMESARTKAVQYCCRVDIDNIIGLSGTPIKNNSVEYYPILNILRPDKFYNKNAYIRDHVDTYYDGYKMKVGGLRNPDQFKEFTKDFIIRRTRAEVLPDLPLIFRQFEFFELGEVVENEYETVLKEFMNAFDEGDSKIGAFAFQSNILAYLSRMRHLTGKAKVDPVVEYVEEFMLETDRKLAIYVHHHDVAKLLQYKLEKKREEWPVEWGEQILNTVDIPAAEAAAVIEQWKLPQNRICILSTLASGEGLNLQFCSDCIIMERQWNPANEEQAEARFPRPGQTADKINSIYFVAVGTVDEFFSELVEQKRTYMASTLEGKKTDWNESSLIKELTKILREKGGKKWGW